MLNWYSVCLRSKFILLWYIGSSPIRCFIFKLNMLSCSISPQLNFGTLVFSKFLFRKNLERVYLSKPVFYYLSFIPVSIAISCKMLCQSSRVFIPLLFFTSSTYRYECFYRKHRFQLPLPAVPSLTQDREVRTQSCVSPPRSSLSLKGWEGGGGPDGPEV